MPREFAFLSREWAIREACGVCKGIDGKLYFFWQIVWEDSKQRCLNSGQELICEVDHVVSTVEMVNDEDGDMIDDREHARFLKQWKDKVENPEVADLFLNNMF